MIVLNILHVFFTNPPRRTVCVLLSLKKLVFLFFSGDSELHQYNVECNGRSDRASSGHSIFFNCRPAVHRHLLLRSTIYQVNLCHSKRIEEITWSNPSYFMS